MAPTPRFAYIDSARAIAAGLVVWQHTAELAAALVPDVSNRWMADVLRSVDLGRLGVILFFAISGYVIPSSLDQADSDAGRKFVIRRFFRLYPAFWLSIPLGFAALWALYDRAMPTRDLLLNFTMLPTVFGAKEVIGLYWTLAYEMAFYALCLILWRCRLLERPWTMLALTHLMLALGGALLLASVYQVPTGGWALTCFFYGIMFTGTTWRQWRDGRLTDRWQRLGAISALVIWFVWLPLGCYGVLVASGRYIDYFVKTPMGYAGGLLAFMLLTTVAKLNWRPIAWVGLVSYSLYLLHPVTLYSLARVIEARAPARIDVALFMATEVVLALLLAATAFYAVERPAIAMGRRLSGRPGNGPLRPTEEVI